MTEAYKLARVLLKRTATNGKCTAYMDKKLNIKQAHNFTGAFIEKAVYENGKVSLYDKEGKEIDKPEPQKAKKGKASRKLPDFANEESDRDI